MVILRWILAGLTFLLEIGLWWGAGHITYRLLHNTSRPAAIIAAVAVTALFLLAWGMFLAPRAARRLAEGPRVLVIALLSLLVGGGLYFLDARVPGLILAIPGTAILILGQLLVSR